MFQRFYAATPVLGATAELADGEARHACQVLRLQVGDALTLFDGSGAEFDGRIESISRDRVKVSIIERRVVSREARLDVVLGVALPKGDRQRWLVEKAVELGAVRLVPLLTRRAVARPREATLARLRRAVIEASKQCGRNRLMEISTVARLEDFLTAAPNRRGVLRLLADPRGDAFPTEVGEQTMVLVAIGPEGGFTDEELDQASAGGWRPVSLGPRILRVETAAVAVVASLTTARAQ